MLFLNFGCSFACGLCTPMFNEVNRTLCSQYVCMWCITITSYLFSFHYEYNGAKIFLLHSNNDISGSAEAKTCKTTLSINAEGFYFLAIETFWGGSWLPDSMPRKNTIVNSPCQMDVKQFDCWTLCCLCHFSGFPF